MKPKLTTVTCKRCGHTWVPRKPEIRQCSKCRSSWFDTEKPTPANK